MKTFNPLVFVLVIALSMVGLGQDAPSVKATIKGPTTALAGTLVFLSHEEAIGDNKVWVIPEELKSQSASCGTSVFFSIPTPGKYQFGLIVADKEANIAYSYHTIVVSSPGVTTPPVTPVTPPPTVPPVAPNFDSIRQVSKAGVDVLADASTTQLLQVNLLKTINALPPTLPEAKGAVTATIELCFSMRQPESRGKDWLNQWRIPLDREIAKYNPQDVGAYRECVKAMVRGLCVNGVCPNVP
jgi:hypothetical protein